MTSPDLSSRLPVDPAGWADGLREKRAKHRQRSIPKRVAFALAGIVVLVVGVFAIPLPGPGWAIVFLGLGMLALEFAWAEKLALLVLAGLQWFWDRWLAAKTWQRGIAMGSLFLIGLFAVCLSATLLGAPSFVPKLW